MQDDKLPVRTLNYEPESWRGDDVWQIDEVNHRISLSSFDNPTMREQCRLLDLLGRINYRIISGNRVYVEVGGVVYKTLYGGYWRSVFTGIEHYLLRCEKVSDRAWDEEGPREIDLPIAYSKEGWTTSGHALSFILNRDLTDDRNTFINRLRRLRRSRTIAPVGSMIGP